MAFRLVHITQASGNEPHASSPVSVFQVLMGIILAITTTFISVQTYRLSVTTEQNNTQLKEIEQRLSENRFDFERVRDVYDRTEKYLSLDRQDQARGRALVWLIDALPQSEARQALLSVITERAQIASVAAQAADLAIGHATAGTLGPGFFGDRTFMMDDNGYDVTTMGEFGFVDSHGIRWVIPKGTRITGSTIPRFLWPEFGAPLSSAYTVPALIYSYYCDVGSRPKEELVSMFREALLQTSMAPQKAEILYQAVRSFGVCPRPSIPETASSQTDG